MNVKATDGHGGQSSIPVSIDLTDVNEAPVFTGEATLEAPENQSFAGRVAADDLDGGDAVTDFTITGGADRSLVEINSGGTLSFKDDPDFERPADAGRNNSYVVEVTRDRGGGRPRADRRADDHRQRHGRERTAPLHQFGQFYGEGKMPFWRGGLLHRTWTETTISRDTPWPAGRTATSSRSRTPGN